MPCSPAFANDADFGPFPPAGDPLNQQPAGPKPLKLQWSRYHSAFLMMPARASVFERLKASLGAVGGIALTAVICGLVLGGGMAHPLLVAPMGASAVLLFAVPASPLAQPWPVVGGNVVSAFIGVTAGLMIPDMTIAAGVAVGGAIAGMSLLRCLHPPGGAVALTAVVGGPAAAAWGYTFPLVPVGVNSVLLLAAGYVYHRFSGHRYPHAALMPAPNPHRTADRPAPERAGHSIEDIESALKDYGEELDVSADDLQALFNQVDARTAGRFQGWLRCRHIISTDIVTVGGDTSVEEARALLISRRLQSMPVVDAAGRVEGVVGHLELARPGMQVADVLSPAAFAGQDVPAGELLKPLSDGARHEIAVVDEDGRLKGLITQTDLIAALLARGDLSAKHRMDESI